MTVKEYLNQYREMQKSADFLLFRYKQLLNRNDERAYFFLEQWQQAALDAIEFRQELFELLITLPVRIAELMIFRYIDLNTWDQLVQLTGLTHYTNHRTHIEGLELIQKKKPDLSL